MDFEFDLNQIVTIAISGERGIVIGRAEYTSNANQYQIRYKSASGTAVEEWWVQEALQATEA